MTNNSDSINIRKKNCLRSILKNYLLAPLLTSIFSLLLTGVFSPAPSLIYGLMVGLWIGVILRFIFSDLEPNYVYHIDKTDTYLILDLINPIGKVLQIKIQNSELEKIEFVKKTFWKAFGKVSIHKGGMVENYKTVGEYYTSHSD